MKVGDAVRLTTDQGTLRAGALGVVLEVCRNGGTAVLLVEFEVGKRVVSAAAVEEVTRLGAVRPHRQQ
jgi:hypothetical protein